MSNLSFTSGWMNNMPASHWRLVSCCIACWAFSSHAVLAADEPPSRELLEFLGGFEMKDTQVVDLILDEESGETINVSQSEEGPHE